MGFDRAVRLRGIPKGIAWILLLAWQATEAAPRFQGIEGLASRLAYLVLLALALAGMAGAALVRPAWLRWTFALLFAASTLYVETYMQASRSYLTYDTHINLLGSAGALSDAVIQNEGAIRSAALAAMVVLLAIGLGPVPRPGRHQWLLKLAGPLVVAMVTALLFLRGGDGGKGLPAAYSGFAYTLLERFETIKGGLGERETVQIPRSGKPRYSKIVLLIDESVSANYLDTSGFPGAVRTPLTQPQDGLAIASYGVVASITNCSIGSNAALRFAGTRENYLADIAKGPSLWSYARAAGMRTVYIDAQRTGGELHDAMTREEQTGIDSFVQFDGVPVVDRDMAAARLIAQELASPQPTFIIVNKMGAHFPVQDKFPASFAFYKPIPERGRFVGIGDTGSRAGFDGSAASWRLYRNAYRDTLLWNVGEFFRRLFAHADLKNALVVYTSDHGQDLHESGRPGTTTHCQADPVPMEGAVPLVTITGQDSPLDFTGKTPASHYRIAPTLLAAMGYDRIAVRARYGLALDEGGRDPATFNTLFNARLGRKPVWRKVVAQELAAPPPGDFTSGP